LKVALCGRFDVRSINHPEVLSLAGDYRNFSLPLVNRFSRPTPRLVLKPPPNALEIMMLWSMGRI
jgi:hypothetical protein